MVVNELYPKLETILAPNAVTVEFDPKRQKNPKKYTVAEWVSKFGRIDWLVGDREGKWRKLATTVDDLLYENPIREQKEIRKLSTNISSPPPPAVCGV